jgi:hypothetical protein
MKSVRLPRIVDLLTRQVLTAHELAATVYCTQRSAQILVAKLRRSGLIYVTEWRRVGTVWVAVYAYGIGSDATRPKPLTARERLVKWRAKESLDDHAFRMARERAKKWKIKRDPLVAAFYGDSKPLR